MGSEMEPTNRNAEKRLNLKQKRKRNLCISEDELSSSQTGKVILFPVVYFSHNQEFEEIRHLKIFQIIDFAHEEFHLSLPK